MLPKYHLNYAYMKNPLEFDDLLLIQIGRMHCTDSVGSEAHRHMNLFELTIITGGSGEIFTNGVGSKVKSGDIYLSLPYDLHEIKSSPNSPLKFDFFAFTPTNKTFIADFEQIMQNYYSAHDRIIQDVRIQNAVRNSLNEIKEDGVYSSLLLSAIFRQLLIYIILDFKEKTKIKKSTSTSSAEILCLRVMNYIETHIFTIKNLQELSSVSDYSYGYLSNLFKKTTSVSLSDFFHEKKIAAACTLIAENKMSITEISQRLNYSSVYAFSKAFKNYCGVSPKIYQIECRKNKNQRAEF